jgi:hypothetical protein
VSLKGLSKAEADPKRGASPELHTSHSWEVRPAMMEGMSLCNASGMHRLGTQNARTFPQVVLRWWQIFFRDTGEQRGCYK